MSIIRNSRVSAVEGFEYIEVYGNTIRTFRIVRYYRRYQLSGVPLYILVDSINYFRRSNPADQLFTSW